MYNLRTTTGADSFVLTAWQLSYPAVEMKFFNAVSAASFHRFQVTEAIKYLKQYCGAVGGKLAAFAKTAPYDLICFPGAPGQFLCTEENAECLRPTIIWDPYTAFQYYYRPDPLLKQVKPAMFPAWLVLGHELGHFWHYTRDKEWYTGLLASKDIAGIEARNLEDHEIPMTKSAELPPRVEYKDYRGSTTEGELDLGGTHWPPTLQKGLAAPEIENKTLGTAFTKLKAAVDKANEALEAKKEKADYEKTDIVCSVCSRKFSSVGPYNFHIIFGKCPAPKM